MNPITVIKVALVSAIVTGCSAWPSHGEGGMAEHTDRLPNCQEVHAGSAYEALDQRLACANRRFEILKRVGAQIYQPALSEQARLQSQRSWRQLTGGLIDDALTDLVIYGALLDELERRLLAQGALSAAPLPATMAVVEGAVESEWDGRHVLFVSGSDQVNPAALDALRVMVEALGHESEAVITLIGYTDDQGDEADNATLALRRAQNVKLALVALGVAQQRVYIQGRGERNPVYANVDRTTQLANRRVDLILGIRSSIGIATPIAAKPEPR